MYDSMCELHGVITRVEKMAYGTPFYALMMDNGKVDYHTQFLTLESEKPKAEVKHQEIAQKPLAKLLIICDCGAQDTSLAHVNACPVWQARLRKNWQEPKVLDRGERLLVNELNRPYYMNQVRQDSYN